MGTEAKSLEQVAGGGKAVAKAGAAGAVGGGRSRAAKIWHLLVKTMYPY